MGEVYRARDTRLDRSAAIKILPKEFAANAALKSRFERETKVISSLKHAHATRETRKRRATKRAASAAMPS